MKNYRSFPSDTERFTLGRVALGVEAPDLIISGGSYLNVFTRTIERGDIWIRGKFIARITTDPCGFNTPVFDAADKILTPGFVEGHIHVESSLVDPPRYAEAALRCGVTSVFTDFHEVGAVAGRPGIREMLEAMHQTPMKVFFMTPMELPFLPELQHTLHSLSPEEAADFLREIDTVGLAEVNGAEIARKLIHGSPDDFALLTAAAANRRTPEGHLFFTRGKELDACLAVGMSSDHEPRKQDEVAEKVRKGLFVMLRNGTLAREVETLIGAVTAENLPRERIGLVSDDIMITDITPDRYMLHKVRTAVKSGITVPDALRMVSCNIAEHYRLGELIGGLRPGAYADVLVFQDLENFRLEQVFASGRLVEPGVVERSVGADYSPELLHTIRRDHLVLEDLRYLDTAVDGDRATIRVIELDETTRFTTLRAIEVPVRDGDVSLDIPQEDMYYLICANRQNPKLLGKAFLRGYGLHNGGIAVSHAHDHHGIVALGRTRTDVIMAANRLIDLQGGVVLVQNGRISAELALPVAGLMSPLPIDETAAIIRDIETRLRSAGVGWREPLFFLFWLGMEVAPYFRITDLGLFDTENNRVVPCIVTQGDHD